MEGDKHANRVIDNVSWVQSLAIVSIVVVLILALSWERLEAGWIGLAAIVPVYAIVEALSANSRVWKAFWAGSLFMGTVMYLIMTALA